MTPQPNGTFTGTLTGQWVKYQIIPCDECGGERPLIEPDGLSFPAYDGLRWFCSEDCRTRWKCKNVPQGIINA